MSTWQWNGQSFRLLAPGLGNDRFHFPGQKSRPRQKRGFLETAGFREQVVLKIRWQKMRTLLFLIAGWAYKKILGYSARNHCP